MSKFFLIIGICLLIGNTSMLIFHSMTFTLEFLSMFGVSMALIGLSCGVILVLINDRWKPKFLVKHNSGDVEHEN